MAGQTAQADDPPTAPIAYYDLADVPEEQLTRGQRMVRQLSGKATQDVTFEEIAGFTRSEV